MITGHGGNKKNLAEKTGCRVDDIIDMSCNLNPLGPPETIEKLICDNLDKIRSLPEPDAAAIRKGFASFHGIDSKNVVAGNGTTWFIYTIPNALGSKKAIISGPSYSDYKDACMMHKTAFLHCLAKEQDNFDPDIDEISRMAKGADTVFICNPNNPTGSLISREKLEYLIQKHENTVFIIDESYLPFVDRANDYSLVTKTLHENLIVLSSMSKIFRIPGLRTGFLSAARGLVEKIMTCYQPWSVNALAQAVIEDIFCHHERIEPFFLKTREYIKEEKKVFIKSLQCIKGIKLFDSHTYFILARLTGGVNSGDFCSKIGQHKILIRDCSNFYGLSDQYVRFSLKERRTNLHLADLIRQTV
ncbi:MAG: aminotransferase class I/II-fold pyridoxal phosphate-dependent enzyme [Deltaproteobacteria bacterium]|nr:aminotransferase class I/II-fold pyridoxal phosphate-dependent enzyme [Deltaproteobacteria bacterium]